ncbi:MAG: L-aspartate oxidase [SAR324 cluster bacterium]|nr:L-aspartate oxidase [SAR324 cluster bacterium]
MSNNPLIIAGSGLAGLLTALISAEHRPVLILTKKKLTDSNTEQSQGGIAAVWAKEDSAKEHIQDTILAGSGYGNTAAITLMSEKSKTAINQLIEFGVRFDQDENGEYLLALEGAHSRPRVLHAGGDATGTEIMRALTRETLRHPNITILEDASLAEIVTKDNQIQSVKFYQHNIKLEEIPCRDLVLCTGGAGNIFQFTSNPPTATGEGIILAYQAGAKVKDLEFFQFHPTALNIKGAPNFLISEALRGAGAIVRDHNNYAFMTDIDPRGDLASRDIVSRAIFAKMKDGPVYLDATHLGHKVLKTRFPNIFHTCLNHGVNIGKDLIPVTPVAHYLMGGVETDLNGRSNVKGLYVAGEAACTGVHGANRLASNSLLEGAIFAMQVAGIVELDAKTTPSIWQDVATKARGQVDLPKSTCNLDRQTLQKEMWDKAGIVRDEGNLKHLLKTLGNPEYMKPETKTQEEFEFQNMLVLGRLITQAALSRKVSLGSHFRADN